MCTFASGKPRIKRRLGRLRSAQAPSRVMRASVKARGSVFSWEPERGTRLGGKTDKFAFAPIGEYLRGNGVVAEPHSFDVEVIAVHAGKTHKWSYASYEGRTTIADKAAADAGVTTEAAGPATVRLTVSLLGAVELAPGAKAELRARFPGRVVSVTKNVADKVNAGETLARVESNESLQTYSITAPVGGVVLSRDVNPGDVTDDRVLFVVGDTSKLAAQFHVFDRDGAQVKAGQAAEIRVDALPGKVLHGKIKSVGTAIFSRSAVRS